MQLSRHFSVDEADGLLPAIVRVFKVVRPLHAKLLVEAAKMNAGGHKPDISGRMISVELPPEVAARQRYIRQLSMAIQQMLHEIAMFGIEVKSAEGLIDFRSRLDGRTVYLCWKWGEENIAWYHDVQGGYAGRKPITDRALFSGDGCE
ncbi:MAG: DUF2203 domain-containing protein [Myxococcales bacterium]|nr:DUF2203 domain-containing protein [Myxococcales bacterium]